MLDCPKSGGTLVSESTASNEHGLQLDWISYSGLVVSLVKLVRMVVNLGG
jgi:hypothetical protein